MENNGSTHACVSMLSIPHVRCSSTKTTGKSIVMTDEFSDLVNAVVYVVNVATAHAFAYDYDGRETLKGWFLYKCNISFRIVSHFEIVQDGIYIQIEWVMQTITLENFLNQSSNVSWMILTPQMHIIIRGLLSIQCNTHRGGANLYQKHKQNKRKK